MRAPTRVLALSLVVFITFIVVLSRKSAVESVTHSLNVRFPMIRERWLQAKEQARLGSDWSSSYTGSSGESRPQDSHRVPLDKEKGKEVKVTNDGSTTKSNPNEGPQSDRDREAFRGFTDAEQEEARVRLESTYGQAAKEDLSQDTDVVKAALDGLPQRASTTDPSWESEPTEVLDKEKAKAQSILEGMFGAETQAPKEGKPEVTEEVGWRTTGVNTAIANRTHTPAAFITANPSDSPDAATLMDEVPTTLTTRVHATTPAEIPEEYATRKVSP